MIKNIGDHKRKFHKYLQGHSYQAVGRFDPWNIVKEYVFLFLHVLSVLESDFTLQDFQFYWSLLEAVLSFHLLNKWNIKTVKWDYVVIVMEEQVHGNF